MRTWLFRTASVATVLLLGGCMQGIRPLTDFGLSPNPEKAHFYVTSEEATGFYYAPRRVMPPAISEAEMATAGFGPHSIDKLVSPDAGLEFRFVPICYGSAARRSDRYAAGDRRDIVKVIKLPCP